MRLGNLGKSYKLFFSRINNGISLEPVSKEVERQGTLVPYDGGCRTSVSMSDCGSLEGSSTLPFRPFSNEVKK